MRTSARREIARKLGIELSYTDAAGKRRNASPAALAAAIDVRSRSRREEPRLLEPVIVAWGTQRPKIDLHGVQNVEWDLELEDGSWRSGRASGSFTLDPLPHGYHTLRIHREQEALLIAAPLKAHAPRGKSWGIFAPLYAAHTRRSWGAGDLGDLLAYASWIDHHGGSIVATLPMLAQHADEPSPYSPVSRLFWNELYLDVTRVPEFRAEDVDEGTLARLRQTTHVDYAGILAEKHRVLRNCLERFVPDRAFATFASGEANEYANWRGADARLHLYMQYRLSQQMREVANAARRLGNGLYLDFPLGVHSAGYDAQRYAHVFARGVSSGAPPDLFFTKGQNWGFPPFDPDALREDRYDYFRKAIRHHVAHAGVLRIDHVMGLHRLYWIPDGMEAKDGVYVRYPVDELYAILTLESQRHGCVLVGEDLGTVPPEVPKKMVRHGLRRMYVVQYEMKPEEATPPPPPAASVASLNTHDMPAFAAWSAGQDPDRAHSLESLLMFLASSDAELLLLNLEDLWGETEPQNVPGVPERSWRHKFRMGLEDARADGSIRRIFTNVAAQRADDLLSIRGPHNDGMKEG
ncbi:MAG TPA: 4-alpha-glucanotransferase [Thermoanaerobaculia bacterium]|nr:4-alpha-glucanotransferase [Thermoanaerobaculia bacterium]